MIDLYTNISEIFPPYITLKLKEIDINYLGDLIQSSLNLNDLKISEYLKKYNLDFTYNMSLDELLNTNLIEFNYNKYQNMLEKSHNSNELLYSDSISIVKPLIELYRIINFEESSKLDLEFKIKLDDFIKRYMNMPIYSFLFIKNYSTDIEIARKISDILGLPLEDKLNTQEIIERENDIFSGKQVKSDMLKAYENLRVYKVKHL